MALEKLSDGSSRKEANHRAELSIAQESLQEKKASLERLERELATKVEKRRQPVAKRGETSKTASRQFADGDDSLQTLCAKVVAITTGRDKWYSLATEISDNPKTAEEDVAPQSPLRTASLKDVDARTAELDELQERLTARNPDLSKLDTQNRNQADESSQVRTHNVTGCAVPNVLK